MSEDPNKVRNDPMVPEYWLTGEDLQDKIRALGYDSPIVDGIAVDFHDLLQASLRIQEEIVPSILATDVADKAKLLELLRELRYEFDHIRWHSQSATNSLDCAIQQVEGPSQIQRQSDSISAS
jgi:hypothetical protein